MIESFPASVMAVWLAMSLFASGAPQATGGPSPTCHQVEGKTTADYERVLKFCSVAVPPALDIQGVIAMDSLLWIKIGRPLANVMRQDKLSAERVVKNWMTVWRSLTGRPSVRVTVQWQDVDVAVGDTTIFSGDRVTIK